MCLLLFSHEHHPNYKMIVAANRDEFYNRPTKPAHFWEDKSFLLAGKDLQAGGTWLGITKQGRFAAITNYREMQNIIIDSPSRGKLVTDFLENNASVKSYSGSLLNTAKLYNGYNLITMDSKEISYFSNKTNKVLTLSSGIYALSNHLLDTPWPKVEKSRKSFISIIDNKTISTDDLFNVLSDTSTPPDELLPDTGLELEIERAVSPVFVATPFYGTRSSTVILIDRMNNVTFIEKSLNIAKNEWVWSSFQFRIEQ